MNASNAGQDAIASSAKASPSYQGSAYGAANSQATTIAAATAGAVSTGSTRSTSQARQAIRSRDPIWIHTEYAPGPKSDWSPTLTSCQGVARETLLLAALTWSSTCGPATA